MIPNYYSIITIIKNDYKFFFSKINVEGIALGYKQTNGIMTKELCIQIFVKKKIAINYLPNNQLIPPIYKKIKTDVIESGIFSSVNFFHENRCQNNYSYSLTNEPYVSRIRPIQPSYCMSVANSIFFSFVSTGSLGYIVVDNLKTSTTYCLLSVNKTFSDLNNAPIGESIIQPATSYEEKAPEDTVAKLLRYTPIVFNTNIPSSINDFNTIDASVASYFNIGQIQLINPFIPDIGIPQGIISPELNQPIQWTGCRSGNKKGFITSLNAIIKVQYPNGRTAWFKDVTISSGLCFPQDCGALVCSNKDIKAIGLLFSCSNINVGICNITNITQALNITLLTL